MAAVASTSKRHREGETSGELSEGAGRAGGRGGKAKVLGGRTRMPGADCISRGREQRGRARGRGRVGRPPTGPESRTGGGRRPALGISCLDGVQSPCSCLWARCSAPRTQGHTGDGHADAGESGDAPGDTRTHAGNTASVKSLWAELWQARREVRWASGAWDRRRRERGRARSGRRRALSTVKCARSQGQSGFPGPWLPSPRESDSGRGGPGKAPF